MGDYPRKSAFLYPRAGVVPECEAMHNIQQSAYTLICYGCGASYEEAGGLWTCGGCGEPLSIRMRTEPAPEVFHERPASMWHYADLLPIAAHGNIVTLGEGATPLVAAPRLARHFDLGELWSYRELLAFLTWRDVKVRYKQTSLGVAWAVHSRTPQRAALSDQAPPRAGAPA